MTERKLRKGHAFGAALFCLGGLVVVVASCRQGFVILSGDAPAKVLENRSIRLLLAGVGIIVGSKNIVLGWMLATGRWQPGEKPDTKPASP